MDTAEAAGGSSGPASSSDAGAVSDDSPKEPPPGSPESRDDASAPEDTKQPTATDTTAAVPTATVPTPPPRHCLGARGYDGGYFDVGSFFVFHQEPPALPGPNEEPAGSPRGVDSGLLAPPPPPSGTPSSPPPATADRQPSPLGYDFLDGLKVKPSEHQGKAVEGEGSEEAMSAFVELQRQVKAVAVGDIYPCLPFFTRRKISAMPVGATSKRARSSVGKGHGCGGVTMCHLVCVRAKHMPSALQVFQQQLQRNSSVCLCTRLPHTRHVRAECTVPKRRAHSKFQGFCRESFFAALCSCATATPASTAVRHSG